MEPLKHSEYQEIAAIINCVKANFKWLPGIGELASFLGSNPLYIQQLFEKWAGTSYEEFFYYISPGNITAILKNEANLFSALYDKKLHSANTSNSLIFDIGVFTDDEFSNKDLNISYSFAQSPFGRLIIASTYRGICYAAFIDDESRALQNLKTKFPNAVLNHQSDILQENALLVFQNEQNITSSVKLHLKGTDFQLRVWKNLLQIPFGELTTYGRIARQIDNPKASRAVGTAIGSNPVAFFIPCHRVIQNSGTIGGYMWGPTRKAAIIGWEVARKRSVRI
ncbi:MAG: methylated-DNA--[protein]-cysteine S-methyltransferase [Bacteroidales bacterium]